MKKIIALLLILTMLPLSTIINTHPVFAALTDTVVPWANFNFIPITYGGTPVYDYEGASDPSNGGTAVQPATADISSCSANGSLPGTQPSFLVAYYDNSTPGNYADDYIAFRIRLNDDPTETGLARGYQSGHWEILIDIDNDNYKEFVIDLDGSVNSQNPDRVYLLYNNNDSQLVTGRSAAQRAANDTLGGDEIGVWYASGPGATGNAQTYNHTRVLTATPSCFGGNEYWLDIQLPLSAFTTGGPQLLTPDTPSGFFASTSASIINPLQKDWMRTPFAFSDDPLDPAINATKTDSLLEDNDSNTIPSPGDVLLYTIVITNTGTISADNVTYHDVITDLYLTLTDNVSTSQGSIIHGNTAGDTEVQIYIGSIDPGNSVTITFRVTIDNPVPDGVDHVENHGLVVGSNFTDEPTDDPDTQADNDPTITPITAAPLIDAFKTDSLYNDADLNTIFSPGDTILYTISIENNGNQDATGVVLDDPLCPYRTLVVGSVTTSQGTVTTGNTAGDDFVEVNIGTVTAGSTITITFQVIILGPLPPEITQICNQGVVSGNNFPSEPTDDPDTPNINDPTYTPVTAAPIIDSFKHVTLADDVDNNNIVSPGDILDYNITITNYGNQNATGVVFTDTPDTNTTLVNDSVITSQGTVTSGNSIPIVVTIGTIAGGGGEVTISFKVSINNPLPQGTTTISNQGLITGDNFTDEPTDDPTTSNNNDPTDIHATAAPSIHFTKTDILSNDADNNRVVSDGDIVTYIITIINNGNAAADNVTFSDNLTSGISLVSGSVSTSIGTVTTGNTTGDSIVVIDIPSIPPEVTVHISFNVEIGSGCAPVYNQGIFDSLFPAIHLLSDDPDTAANNDATMTSIVCPTPASTIPVPTTTTPYRRQQSDVAPSGPESLVLCNRPDQLCIINMSVQPAQANINQPIIIFASIANRCETPTNFTVTMKINGLEEEVQKGSLPGNMAKSLTFTTLKTEPGNYEVELNGEVTYFTVIGEKGSIKPSQIVVSVVFSLFCIGIFILLIALLRKSRSSY